MSRDREDTIKFDRQYCQHYDPGGVTMIGGKDPSGVCKAGVNYLQHFGDGPGIFMRLCCTSGNKKTEAEQLAACPKWERRTMEQATARADEFEDYMRKMEAVGPVVAAWRKKPPRGKAEVIECPACNGRLHLSQAASNGHVHGCCETEGCVSWME